MKSSHAICETLIACLPLQLKFKCLCTQVPGRSQTISRYTNCEQHIEHENVEIFLYYIKVYWIDTIPLENEVCFFHFDWKH